MGHSSFREAAGRRGTDDRHSSHPVRLCAWRGKTYHQNWTRPNSPKRETIVGKDSSQFNLFTNFATSELTHSGVWGWILQSLDPDCPAELRELRRPAMALLDRLNSRLDGAISVRRECKLSAGRGRVDIEVKDELGQTVVIETKVKAAPDVAQRERYAAAYGEKLVGITILSTGFDDPWNHPGAGYLGAKDVLEILEQGDYESQTMRQYVAWLRGLIALRQERLCRALGEDPV